jgi:hypothetical protein
MDLERNNYKRLSAMVDHAFAELRKNPQSSELNIAYLRAKEQLDNVLADLVSAVEKRYKDV